MNSIVSSDAWCWVSTRNSTVTVLLRQLSSGLARATDVAECLADAASEAKTGTPLSQTKAIYPGVLLYTK